MKFQKLLGMTDGITEGKVAGDGKDRVGTVAHLFYTREGILAAPLVERGGGYPVSAGILRNRDVARLFVAGLAHFLLHPGLDGAGLLVGGFQPLAPGKADGMLGKCINDVVIVGYRNGIQCVVVIEPQMPAPQNLPRGVFNANDGIAVLDLVGGHVEVEPGVLAAARHLKAGGLHDAALVAPDDVGLRGGVGGVLHVDVGRSDGGIVMDREMM